VTAATRRNPLGAWPEFASAVRERLKKGQVEYGDRSFSADPAILLREIREEIEDICGWSYVTWCRIQKLEQALGRGSEPPSSPVIP
jgi:hypothetical protein